MKRLLCWLGFHRRPQFVVGHRWVAFECDRGCGAVVFNHRRYATRRK